MKQPSLPGITKPMFSTKFLTTRIDEVQTDEFDKIVERRIGRIREVLVAKAKEYATNGDRLHNFNAAAQIFQAAGLVTSRELALAGMMMKHFVSVLDLIKDPTNATQYLIDEKIGDMINYLVLLEVSLTDTINDNKTPF